MSQINDIALVAQVVVFKNTRAFDTLVKKYQSPIRRFFLHQTLGDTELSDDLAQETFIKAYTNLASFKNLSSFSTWLYRIAYNIFYDYIRSKKETSGLETWEIDAVYQTEQRQVGEHIECDHDLPKCHCVVQKLLDLKCYRNDDKHQDFFQKSLITHL